MSHDIKRLEKADCLRLGASLVAEESNYRRLLRLAWRQNSYMQRQDVDRLESNATDWSRAIPAADAARISRERLVSELATKTGVTIPPGRVEDLLDYTDQKAKSEVRSALTGLRRAAARLARQNEINRTLAEFCLDLSREETEVFKQAVLADPKGAYDGNANTAARGPGGVVQRQA
jgi:hypothetical protein